MQIREVLKEYYNVLKMARKPDWEEFNLIARVAVVIMLIVGLVGFIIYLLLEILPGVFK
ncbi:MAG: protein translocase SEC61 complex subunit gamma [Archaeoglobaceae archaeon]|nr:protein translocase SEC61 complex subunit gamma [Archaeoglobaceae archaeon]MCX8151884.1 protein translocase SEC61 complex subunit gamma [Archaeoglobaceae archaeon]MDW8013273.1 protein translocase SEC61 complex subunit gamma [Archaeoglobaceae archaeon]